MSKTPDRCRQCRFYQSERLYEDCTVCVELGFRESVLCGLNNQETAGARKFVCHRFRPDLKIVGAESEPDGHILPLACDRQEYFRNVLAMINGQGRCDNGGCRRCGGSEGRGESPPARRYHVVWITAGRRPIFNRPESYISFFHNAFLTCGALINGKACLVWLAADHLHFYLELEGDELVMDVVDDIQFLINDALLEEFKELDFRPSDILWNSRFYIENIDE